MPSGKIRRGLLKSGQVLVEFIQGALAEARFEVIEDEEPIYAEIPGLRGVWATGKNREACRHNLAAALDGWIIVRLRKGRGLPRTTRRRMLA